MDENLIAQLACEILLGKMTIEDLEKYNSSIKEEVLNTLHLKNQKIGLLVNKILIQEELDKSDKFDLERFLDKPDFSIGTHKAALGLIYDNHAFYCEVPFVSSHAHVATAYYRRKDPNYEELSVYGLLHPNNGKEWQDKLMEEDHAIVIHFLPNEYGEAFFIPENITNYQKEELERINSLLQARNIATETNYEDKNLSEYLTELKSKAELKKMIEEGNEPSLVMSSNEIHVQK